LFLKKFSKIKNIIDLEDNYLIEVEDNKTKTILDNQTESHNINIAISSIVTVYTKILIN